MATQDAREQILDAAERLIAEHGADVPLRDIAMAADQRNNSAVQYHFGSRDGLISAVVERRMATLEARRMEMLAEHESTGAELDLRALVEMLAAPLLEGQRAATHYCRFLEAVRNHPVVSNRMQLARQDRAAVRIITARLDRALGEFPAALRRRRLEALITAMFALLADHERTPRAGRDDAGDEHPAAEDIIDMLVGLLTAPAAPRAAAQTALSSGQ